MSYVGLHRIGARAEAPTWGSQLPEHPRALQAPHLSVSRRPAWSWVPANVCHTADAAWLNQPPGSLSITLTLAPCPIGLLLPFVACRGRSPGCPGRAQDWESYMNCNPGPPPSLSLVLQSHTQATLFVSLGVGSLICRVAIIILASQGCGEDGICESVVQSALAAISHLIKYLLSSSCVRFWRYKPGLHYVGVGVGFVGCFGREEALA